MVELVGSGGGGGREEVESIRKEKISTHRHYTKLERLNHEQTADNKHDKETDFLPSPLFIHVTIRKSTITV